MPPRNTRRTDTAVRHSAVEIDILYGAMHTGMTHCKATAPFLRWQQTTHGRVASLVEFNRVWRREDILS